MRKQELIHFHALATVIREFIAERETVGPDAFLKYDQKGIRPTSVHRNKTAHKESLQLLLVGILRSIGYVPAENAA